MSEYRAHEIQTYMIACGFHFAAAGFVRRFQQDHSPRAWSSLERAWRAHFAMKEDLVA
ncbi:hypothetical protein L7H23_01070 [Sphingopyxis sp. BSN-002]|uniref:hypothetical protein n=1 Tax=Sphingopyxis sp. BSN-002 TaxID=2911495 RepID=UPI001EDC34F0|nr:hypothetical protein [Sphingopyxis sp. BSN-002]UKK84724.1 hypothetical protein L7H23_01070 [Sphingopyxis sp. BSN-002]